MIWILAVLLASQAPGPSPDSSLDLRAIHETVDSLASVVSREYFDEAVAARLAAGLRRSLSEGRYDALGNADSFAAALSRDLFEASKDKHLSVAVVRKSGLTAVQDETREVRARRENYGVRRVEVLPGNIGYLDLSWFYRLEEAGEALAAAMRVLQHTDSIIFDMRGNGGGSPDTVALLASYQFEAPSLPLFEIVARGGGGRSYVTSSPAVPGRNGKRPAYVLTSARTFSAAEGFAFILQERHRAEIVGEQTAGAANPGRPYPVGARFEVTVPNGQVRGGVTGRNWEGTGVTPEVRTKASDALRVAETRALRELLKTTADGPWRESLKRRLDTLENQGER